MILIFLNKSKASLSSATFYNSSRKRSENYLGGNHNENSN